MSVVSKAFLAAVIVFGGVTTVSAASMRTFYDDSGAWHMQEQSGISPGYPDPSTAAPPVYVLPTTVEEPFTFQEQERLDIAQGHIG